MLGRAELEAKITELERMEEESGAPDRFLMGNLHMDRFERLLTEAKTSNTIDLQHFTLLDGLSAPRPLFNQHVASLCRALLSPKLSHLTFFHSGNRQMGIQQLKTLLSVLAIHPNLKQLVISSRNAEHSYLNPWNELRNLMLTSRTLERIGIDKRLLKSPHAHRESFHHFMQEAATIHTIDNKSRTMTAIYIYTDPASILHQRPRDCILPERKTEFSVCMDFPYQDLEDSKSHLGWLTLACADIALRDHEHIDVLPLTEEKQPLHMMNMGGKRSGPISIISDYLYPYQYTYVWSIAESVPLLDKNALPEAIARMLLIGSKPGATLFENQFITQLLETTRVKTFFQEMNPPLQIRYFDRLAQLYRAQDNHTHQIRYLLEKARVATTLEDGALALDCLRSIIFNNSNDESKYTTFPPLLPHWQRRMTSYNLGNYKNMPDTSPSHLTSIIAIAKDLLENYINNPNLANPQDASNELRICALFNRLFIGYLNQDDYIRNQEQFDNEIHTLIELCFQLEEKAIQIEANPKAYIPAYTQENIEDQSLIEDDEELDEASEEEVEIKNIAPTTAEESTSPPPREGKEEKVTAEEETKEIKAEVKENQRAASSTDTRKKELDARRNQHWQMWTPPDSSRTSTSSSSSSSSSHTPPPPSHDKKPH